MLYSVIYIVGVSPSVGNSITAIYNIVFKDIIRD